VDGATKIIRPAMATAANIADCSVSPDLLHRKKQR
jgi:hypothetical protein